MNKEEIQDILEELHLVRPEILKPKTKKLFEAIMSIADERDELKQQNQKYKEVFDKAIEYIEYNDEDLYVYNPDYDYEENIVANYDGTTFREDLLEILKGDSDVKD